MIIPELIICGRCYKDVNKLFEAPCLEKPEQRINEPIGMYHCPDCGSMILAGMIHPQLCKECVDEIKNIWGE